MIIAGSRLLVAVTLLCHSAMAAALLAASAATGAASLAAAGVQALVMASNQGLLAYSLGRMADGTRQSADTAESDAFFWSLVAPILLLGIGAGVAISEGTGRLVRVEPLVSIGWGYFVLGAAALFWLLSAWSARADRQRRVTNDPDLMSPRSARDPALAVIDLQNQLAISGLVVAGIGLFGADRQGWPAADGLAAVVIGLLLAYVAGRFALEVRALLARHGGAAPPTAQPSPADGDKRRPKQRGRR